MSDETVEHRFIQIHQACESLSDQKNEFWTRLALPSNNTIATSHMCEKLYTSISNNNNNNNKEHELSTALQNLQNLTINCSDIAKQVVFLRAITRLVMLNTRIRFEHIKDIGRSKGDTKVIHQVHPFIVLVRQNSSLYPYLLNEIDYIFANFDASACLNAVSVFMVGLFLTENQVDPGALLGRLTYNITSSNASQMLSQLFEMTKDLVREYPLHKDDVGYFCLVDWIIWLNMSAPIWNVQNQDLQANQFMYTVVDRTLTSVTDGKSIMAHLIRLERIIMNVQTEFNFDVMWTSLSYTLLKVQTVEEQKSIVRMMKNMKGRELASNIVLRVAYIPYYQLLSELNDKGASESIQMLKKQVLEMIDYLDQNKTPLENTEVNRTKMTHDDNLYLSTYGMLSRILCHLEYIYTEQESPILDTKYNIAPDSVLTLTLLFSSPFVFSQDDEESIVYSRMAELSCILKTCYKFPLLLFFLRRLHASSDNPEIVTHILKDVIPTLVHVNDPVITSKVLQVILSSIHHSGSPDSSMACLGIKALEHTHALQPRVWQELKKVFTEWVLRRKSGTVRRKVDLSKTGPIRMELTVLTTMRNVCKLRARECAQDILPMVISLLQTCQDLSMASISIMVDIINTCVKTGLVESRSIWNVAVVHLAQFSLDQGVKKSSLLVKQLCKFYAIAGKKDDVSEPYLQFKESILKEYILPLLQAEDEQVTSYALDALSHFSAQDMSTILPEKAMEYIVQCTEDKPNLNQHKVLVTLMSNELDHMRRGLFKAEFKQQKTAVEIDPVQKKEITNEAGEVVGERELEMAASFINSWEDARVAPGLRSGYASAILYILEYKDVLEKQVSMESISKTKWYRCMITSFTDVSLTDHLLVRVSSVQSWKTFFKNALSGTENEMETTVSVLLKDLLARLERSTVPGVTCNIALALTGLVSTVRMYIPSFAASCATEIIQVLLKNYIVLSGSPLSHSAHLMSEEVQFAAKFALGHLAAFVINNDQLASTLYNVLIDSAISSNNKSRNIDTAIDLVQYANGYAAGHFIGALAMWPTVTDRIEQMKNTGLQSLISYCGAPVIADSRVLGIMMGLASKLKASYMGSELSFAVDNLRSYLEGNSMNKGLLFGSTWLAAVGAIKENQIDYEISSIIESVMTAASQDFNSAPHFYNFSIPYAKIQYYNYVYSTNDEQMETLYWNAFEPLLDSIQNDDASSNYRIASLFSIGCLLGVSYLNSDEDDSTSIFGEAEKYRSGLRHRGLDKLAFVAGLRSRSAPVGNLKSGRVAAAICGKVIDCAKHMMNALQVASSPHQESSGTNTSAMLSASSEPLSYSRLNANTSYIRAVFDRLMVIENEECISMLLKSLIETPGPLPAVNWFTLVTKVSKMSNKLRVLCLAFASTHATTSLSLSEFLLTQMTSIFKSVHSKNDLDMSVCQVLFEGRGLGTVLELAGLPRVETKQEIKRRGMSAVVKKITISESRAIEMLQLLGQKYQYFDYETQYVLLSNILEHLPAIVDEAKIKFVSSIKEVVMQSMLMYTFAHPDQDGLRQSGYEKIVRQLVACSITNITDLFPTGRLDDWKDVQYTDVFAKMTALCEFYQLHKKDVAMKYMSSAIVHLISMNPYQNETLYTWDVLAETMEKDNEASAWMLRVLDGFVVYIGAMEETEDAIDNLSGSLENGLWSILDVWKVGSPIACCDKTKAVETAFALGNFVTAEQEQIVKRIFKLYDMTQGFVAPFNFLNRLIHALPGDIATQYESKYRLSNQ